MLCDAVRVFEGLEKELERLSAELPRSTKTAEKSSDVEQLEQSFNHLSRSSLGAQEIGGAERQERHRLYILADTSYGACCVDEIAAEHVDAEVVVHYGRSCLSPTARLPVIYVFTSRNLDVEDVVAAFGDTYAQSGSQEGQPRGDEKVVLMADIMYHSHIEVVLGRLQERGWKIILAPEVVHNPSSLIPNRKVEMGEEELKEYSIFHISDPPPALLLTLSSRVKDLHIYPTNSSPSPSVPSNSVTGPTKSTTRTVQSNTSMALRRRYALLTSLSTCGIFGILINTLSVKNYLQTVSQIKEQIAAAGKKSYTFVVGKVNAAKIANFSEIGGWVVIGCWESSLIESTEFYRPIITPFELGLALMGDGERVWDGGWRGDFDNLPAVKPVKDGGKVEVDGNGEEGGKANGNEDIDGGDLGSEEESEPPEFDLRTGRYVSHSRPMRTTSSHPTATPSSTSLSSAPQASEVSKGLTRRANLDLATVNGAVSPGAEYLRSQRTWTGLGSDFHEEESSQSIEKGRSGVARGYTVGKDSQRT
jgi:diphthamide biosynthesis protein 2